MPDRVSVMSRTYSWVELAAEERSNAITLTLRARQQSFRWCLQQVTARPASTAALTGVREAFDSHELDIVNSKPLQCAAAR